MTCEGRELLHVLCSRIFAIRPASCSASRAVRETISIVFSPAIVPITSGTHQKVSELALENALIPQGPPSLWECIAKTALWSRYAQDAEFPQVFRKRRLTDVDIQLLQRFSHPLVRLYMVGLQEFADFVLPQLL
jgi:hypothetical protein